MGVLDEQPRDCRNCFQLRSKSKGNDPQIEEWVDDLEGDAVSVRGGQREEGIMSSSLPGGRRFRPARLNVVLLQVHAVAFRP